MMNGTESDESLLSFSGTIEEEDSCWLSANKFTAGDEEILSSLRANETEFSLVKTNLVQHIRNLISGAGGTTSPDKYSEQSTLATPAGNIHPVNGAPHSGSRFLDSVSQNRTPPWLGLLTDESSETSCSSLRLSEVSPPVRLSLCEDIELPSPTEFSIPQKIEADGRRFLSSSPKRKSTYPVSNHEDILAELKLPHGTSDTQEDTVQIKPPTSSVALNETFDKNQEAANTTYDQPNHLPEGTTALNRTFGYSPRTSNRDENQNANFDLGSPGESRSKALNETFDKQVGLNSTFDAHHSPSGRREKEQLNSTFDQNVTFDRKSPRRSGERVNATFSEKEASPSPSKGSKQRRGSYTVIRCGQEGGDEIVHPAIMDDNGTEVEQLASGPFLPPPPPEVSASIRMEEEEESGGFDGRTFTRPRSKQIQQQLQMYTSSSRKFRDGVQTMRLSNSRESVPEESDADQVKEVARMQEESLNAPTPTLPPSSFSPLFHLLYSSPQPPRTFGTSKGNPRFITQHSQPLFQAVKSNASSPGAATGDSALSLGPHRPPSTDGSSPGGSPYSSQSITSNSDATGPTPTEPYDQHHRSMPNLADRSRPLRPPGVVAPGSRLRPPSASRLPSSGRGRSASSSRGSALPGPGVRRADIADPNPQGNLHRSDPKLSAGPSHARPALQAPRARQSRAQVPSSGLGRPSKPMPSSSGATLTRPNRQSARPIPPDPPQGGRTKQPPTSALPRPGGNAATRLPGPKSRLPSRSSALPAPRRMAAAPDWRDGCY
ncbi:unnamed protein product [Cyprideis torosa]|uniref:Uncharacterized protein n=1 Tax=Cyprideis torosa TaxID=163714 RepID=A0A7R8ZQL3_9CRUS|nr:unnamed protein product [Cyprideis torosa]CAG0896676.1 unnamed protein product [Cyprideis torosa]